MPEVVEVRIDVAGFVAQMEKFERKVNIRIGRKAVFEGSKIFKRLTEHFAPISGGEKGLLNKSRGFRPPGTLKRNIITLRRKGERNTITYSVLVRTAKRVKAGSKRTEFKASGDPFYWYFLEHGWGPTGPHGQTSRDARAKVRAKARARRIVQIPFLKPAFNSGKELALQKVLATLGEEIAKENARVG